MKYVLRIKAVSECFGIRRAALVYTSFKDGEINLENETHPLSAFGKVKIQGDKVILEDQEEKLIPGEESWFSYMRKNDTSSGESVEKLELRIMLLPLDKEAVSYYEKAIEDRYYFDSWNGEFEYIISLIYELDEGNNELAQEWKEKALKKRFPFGFIK